MYWRSGFRNRCYATGFAPEEAETLEEIEKCIEDEPIGVSWVELSSHKYLTENFIIKYYNKLRPYIIYQCQILSEDFIERNVDWDDNNLIEIVCEYQQLSEDFIEKNECYTNKLYIIFILH
jgi:hypothetical protein